MKRFYVSPAVFVDPLSTNDILTLSVETGADGIKDAKDLSEWGL